MKEEKDEQLERQDRALEGQQGGKGWMQSPKHSRDQDNISGAQSETTDSNRIMLYIGKTRQSASCKQRKTSQELQYKKAKNKKTRKRTCK